MKYLAWIAIITLAILGCTQKKQPNTQEIAQKQIETQEAETETQLPTTNDSTLVVNNTHAIMFMADSLELKEVVNKYGQEALAEVASDISYYAMTASDIVDSLGIETTISDKKYLLLIRPDNSQIIIERKKVQEGDMVLFKPGKEPLITFTAGFQKQTAIKYFETQN